MTSNNETSNESIIHKIREYYSSTIWDYTRAWSVEHMHMGLWLNGTKTLQEAWENTVLNAISCGNFREGDLVLDAGCGTGGTVRMLKRAGIRAVGISIVPDHLKIAKSYGNDEYYIMDFHRTGFRDNTFDGIVAIESFCHAKPKYSFLREMYRILKHGKKLVIIDAYRKKDTFFYRKWKECFAVPELPTVDEMLCDLKNAGFLVNFIDMTKFAAKSSRILFIRSLVFPIVWLLYKAGKFNEWQFKNCLGGFLQYLTKLTDSCGYGIWIGLKR